MGVSLSLDNAIMYMQNVLSVIEHKVQNEIRYSLNFKQTVAKQIARLDITQQTFYEDIAHFTNLEGTTEPIVKKEPTKESQEVDETKTTIFQAIDRQQVPGNQEELDAYHKEVRESVHKKHALLLKNTQQYLCYLYLITYNYQKSIQHGTQLLKMEKLAPSTEYNANMYLAECYCMIGQFTDSMTHLEMAERLSENTEQTKTNSCNKLVKTVE